MRIADYYFYDNFMKNKQHIFWMRHFEVCEDSAGLLFVDSHLHKDSPMCNVRPKGKLVFQTKCSGCYTNNRSEPDCEHCSAYMSLMRYLDSKLGV